MATKTFNCTKDASTVKYVSGGLAKGYWSTSGELHLPVGRFDPAGGDDLLSRSFLYFPIDFTGMDEISNATLYVHMRSQSSWHCRATNSFTVHAARMTSDWGEGQSGGEAIWPGGQTWNWDNRANAYTTSGQASWTGTRSHDFKTWDITAIAQAWRSGQPNYGIQLRAASETDHTRSNDFMDRQSGTSVRAYVVITYNTNNAPNAPVNLTPTGGTLVNTLTPTFAGTRSDPDAGDYIRGYQIQAVNDAQTSTLWDSGQVSVSGSPTTFSRAFGTGGTLTSSLVGNTFYRWRARTWDKENVVGPWSAYQRFKVNSAPLSPTVTIEQTPINDLLTLTPTVRLTHRDPDPSDSNAFGYRIIVETEFGLNAGSTVWDTGDTDISGAPLSSVTRTLPTLAWGTGYRVRARTKDSNDSWGPYSANLSFATHTPGVPIDLSPTAGQVWPSLTPTFSGSRAASADTIQSYQIQVFQSDGITLVWDSGTQTSGIVGGQSFSRIYAGPALSFNTQYRWRARITTQYGITAYAPLQVFNTVADATIATPTAPVGTGIPSLTPTFTGTRTSSAFNAFQIQLYPGASTDTNLGTAINDTGTVSQASATSFSRVYNGAALVWNTTYKWRVRVSADGGTTWSGWSGLVQFSTNAAGVAVLISPTQDNSYWITAFTPSFSVGRSGSDVIDLLQVEVYNASGTALIWNSGWVNVTDDTTASVTYSGSPLNGGTVYSWRARYQNTIGPTGPWSALGAFRVNAAPDIPTNLKPAPGTVQTSLFPTFEASFSDADVASMGDYPSLWEIELANAITDDVIAVKAIGSTAALSDTFTWRTIANGWGTPDAGPNWAFTQVSGTATSSTGFGEGIISLSASSSVGRQVADVNLRDSYISGQWRFNKVPTGNYVEAAAELRFINASNVYRLLMRLKTDGNLDIFALRRVSAGDTTLQTITNALTGVGTGSVSFRFEAAGVNPTRLRGRVWATGTPEPEEWAFDLTDSSAALQVVADATVYALTSSGMTNLPYNAVFDNISVGNPNIRPATPGPNVYTWTDEDPALSFSTLYKWRTRFTDSRDAAGTWSGYNVLGFGQPPAGNIVAPTNGSTVNSVSPIVTWNYSHPQGKVQHSFHIELFNNVGTRIFNRIVASSATAFQIPSGYLRDDRAYSIRLTVTDSDMLSDASPSLVNIWVDLDAPDPVQGLSPTTDESYSRVVLEWDQSPLKTGHTFLSYRIYRKMENDNVWTHIGSVAPRSRTEYTDWYAGQGVHYNYRVTIVTRTSISGVELESGDDSGGGNQSMAALESDVWMVVAKNFDEEYIQELPVVDENHSSVSQQEEFEVLGGRRKVVIRGAVLGDEGTMTMMYSAREIEWPIGSGRFYTYTVVGRRMMAFLLNTPGPHILKSPFGDVWMVEFQAPTMRPVSGGHLEVEVSWIETGQSRSADSSISEELYQ
jgi:hypothetical protein